MIRKPVHQQSRTMRGGGSDCAKQVEKPVKKRGGGLAAKGERSKLNLVAMREFPKHRSRNVDIKYIVWHSLVKGPLTCRKDHVSLSDTGTHFHGQDSRTLACQRRAPHWRPGGFSRMGQELSARFACRPGLSAPASPPCLQLARVVMS